MNVEVEISVVVPVYNAAPWLPELVDRLEKVLSSSFKSHEVIYVDDRSVDHSWAVIKEIQQTSQNIKAVRLAKNSGQHAATLCGMKHATGKLVVTLDDDLEFNPEDIVLLYQEMEKQQVPALYGLPSNKSVTFIRKSQVAIYRKLASWINKGGKGSSFRIMKQDIAKSIATHQSPFVFIDEFLLWYADSPGFVTVNTVASKRKKSNYGFFALWRMTLGLIMISSIFPLRMVTVVGFFLMTTNFAIGAYFVVRKLFYNVHVDGYVSIIVSILFSSGVLLFGLGVVAQYISKLLLMNHGKPAYHESEILC